jgi:LysM repeat protein
MNKLMLASLLTMGRMQRITLMVIGLAALISVFFMALAPATASAASRTDWGSTEHYTVGYGKDYGKQQYHKPQYHKPKQHYSCPHVYIVRKGDTLSKLARHYKTTVHALARANGIRDPNKIYVGQRLCVPHGKHYAPPKHSYCKVSHAVKHHDSLVSIAKRYHTTVNKIIADNHLRGPHYIYVGQRLCIR